MSKFGKELVESTREALDVASGRVEPAHAVTVETTADDAGHEPFDPDSEPDRFNWNTGAGMTVIDPSDGEVLITYEDIFGEDEPVPPSEQGNPLAPDRK